MKKKDINRPEDSRDREKDNRFIRFDWAMKDLLRQKDNTAILNGFLTSLLGHEVTIVEILESEGHQKYQEDKFNRVDIIAKNDKGEKILIEVQNDSEDHYFHRMSYGTSKLVTEYLRRGDRYDKIASVYSINIVYFDLGHGSDFAYTGKTEFRGMNDGDILELPERLQKKYDISSVSEIFPQYFILKANAFDRWSDSPLDQWLYFLSTSTIPENATAPGLQEAREKLRVDSLSQGDRESYYQHLDNMTSAVCAIESAEEEGFYNGVKEGKVLQLKETVAALREGGFEDTAIATLLKKPLDIIKGM